MKICYFHLFRVDSDLLDCFVPRNDMILDWLRRALFVRLSSHRSSNFPVRVDSSAGKLTGCFVPAGLNIGRNHESPHEYLPFSLLCRLKGREHGVECWYYQHLVHAGTEGKQWFPLLGCSRSSPQSYLIIFIAVMHENKWLWRHGDCGSSPQWRLRFRTMTVATPLSPPERGIRLSSVVVRYRPLRYLSYRTYCNTLNAQWSKFSKFAVIFLYSNIIIVV
jgi:hypothetical protein